MRFGDEVWFSNPPLLFPDFRVEEAVKFLHEIRHGLGEVLGFSGIAQVVVEFVLVFLRVADEAVLRGAEGMFSLPVGNRFAVLDGWIG